MNENLSKKLKTLPASPGVYFHKDKAGQVIYVGKAAVLKNRVRQYFQKSRTMDAKTRALVADIYDTDWVETESEIDALFLEAEMVKRYMPKYNILLRDDKSLTFVRIDMKSEWPTVSFTRNPLDDGADYFGPFYNSFAVKKALRYLRRIFPYYIKTPKDSGKVDLDVHLGLSPINMNSAEYKANLKKLIGYISGRRRTIADDLNSDMKQAAASQDFEKAASIRDKLRSLNELKRRIMFGDKEFLDISKDKALDDLSRLLKLENIPARIEGYDISHMSGTNVVASMVVFTNGVSDRSEYRKFKTRIDHNNDFFNMNETIARRFSPRNIKSWGLPDLVLIDGGKGQLDAALDARNSCGILLPFIGLAKRDEQIVISNDFEYDSVFLDSIEGYVEKTEKYTLINIPNSSDIIKLLQRIRDESHRFAVSYHTVLKRQQQTENVIDEIPGIGPKTRAKLIRRFGSLKNLKTIDSIEVAKIVGAKKAAIIEKYIQ